MKRFISICLFLAIFTCFAGFNQVKAQDEDQEAVNFDTFYDDLSPYGQWVNHPEYGEVWVYNEPGFRPYYTNGHWDYTDYGWTWESDYDWGWAAFHYGRWEYDQGYGWMWIPGYEWAPAWVSWSEYDDYYGWAPLGYGLDVNISIGRIPNDRWVFMPRQYINTSRIYDYCVPFTRNNVYIRNAHVINNFYGNGGRRRFMMGPDRAEVERYAHSRIEPRRFDPHERFGPSANHNRGEVYNRDRGFNRNGGFNPQSNGRDVYNHRNDNPQSAPRTNGWQGNNSNWNNRGQERPGRTGVTRNDQPDNNPQQRNNNWGRQGSGRQRSDYPNQQPSPAPQRNNDWNNRPRGGFGNASRGNDQPRSYPQRQDNGNNSPQQRGGWERNNNRQENGWNRGGDQGNRGGRNWGGRRG